MNAHAYVYTHIHMHTASIYVGSESPEQALTLEAQRPEPGNPGGKPVLSLIRGWGAFGLSVRGLGCLSFSVFGPRVRGDLGFRV